MGLEILVLICVGVIFLFLGLFALGSEILAFSLEILFILFLRLGGFAFGFGLDFFLFLVGEIEVRFVRWRSKSRSRRYLPAWLIWRGKETRSA